MLQSTCSPVSKTRKQEEDEQGVGVVKEAHKTLRMPHSVVRLL